VHLRSSPDASDFIQQQSVHQCKVPHQSVQGSPTGQQRACTCWYIAVLCFLFCVHTTAGILNYTDLPSPVMPSSSAQAAQVRKSSIGGLGLGGYHPNTHHAYTVHSGTNVEQVRFMLCVLVCLPAVSHRGTAAGVTMCQAIDAGCA
jgi:hypothetical protein